MIYLELKDIEKDFNDCRASDQVNLSVERGRLVALLGPSGSGKTTILRMIAGLETPDAGDIFIDGARVNEVPAGKRDIGFVFQNYALFRYMTVFDNIAFGLKVKKVKRAAIRERVGELLTLVGLEGLEKRYPHQISGGQKQRVAFARALAPNPRLLLLDEPFAAIDAKVRQELRGWLKRMIEQLHITTVFVTHDQDEAVEMAHEIVVINAGRVEQKGSPLEIYRMPATPFVAGFIGRSNVVGNAGELKGFETARAFPQAIVRPEFVRIEKQARDTDKNLEEGTVESIDFRGDNLEVKIHVGSTLLTANYSTEKQELQPGEKVNVLIRRLYAFDDDKIVLLENKTLRL